MSKHQPQVSFGLPVRNEEGCIRRCLDSILRQDFKDFEVVVCDNTSTDGTREILQEYAQRDSRIRLFLNEEDIGQIKNCNRVFELSRGEYFRWIGANDWLEPQYTSSCAAALDNDPEAIAVTTYFRIHNERGNTRSEEYQGELLESERPGRRFARLMWSFHAGDAVYDPIYSMMRRKALERTTLIRMMERADAMLGAELCLLGRFLHVPRILANRGVSYAERSDRPKLMRRYHPTRAKELRSSPWRLLRVLLSVIWAARLTTLQQLLCVRAAFLFFLKEAYRRSRISFHTFRRKRLGLTRQRLAFLRRSER